MASIVPPPASPGARGRIGIIQPAPGVMLEHEWPRWLPSGVLFPVGRVRMNAATSAGYDEMAAASPAVARDLATARVDLVAYACTVGSLYAGAEAERALIASLEAASGKPAISLAATSLLALRQVGASRLAIMTPYTPETNQWVADYVESQGLSVAGFLTTPMSIVTVGDMLPAEVTAFAARGLESLPGADALWIPCTAIQTMDAIAAIEAATGRPAISGTQALLWHALRILGIDDPITGAGSLFA